MSFESRQDNENVPAFFTDDVFLKAYNEEMEEGGGDISKAIKKEDKENYLKLAMGAFFTYLELEGCYTKLSKDGRDYLMAVVSCGEYNEENGYEEVEHRRWDGETKAWITVKPHEADYKIPYFDIYDLIDLHHGLLKKAKQSGCSDQLLKLVNEFLEDCSG